MKRKKIFEEGQSLIEILTALALIVIVGLGLVGINTRSVYNAAFARDQSLATQYAQEAMEKVRVYRSENDWDRFADNCEAIPGLALVPVPFSLAIDCYLPGSDSDCLSSQDSCEIKITISWADAHGTHQTELVTLLTHWL